MTSKNVRPDALRLAWNNVGGQMHSEQQILNMLAPVYIELGDNPAHLVKVLPSYGGWLNALRFQVFRADGAVTWVLRADLATVNKSKLMKALREFSWTRVQPIGGVPVDLDQGADTFRERH